MKHGCNLALCKAKQVKFGIFWPQRHVSTLREHRDSFKVIFTGWGLCQKVCNCRRVDLLVSPSWFVADLTVAEMIGDTPTHVSSSDYTVLVCSWRERALLAAIKWHNIAVIIVVCARVSALCFRWFLNNNVCLRKRSADEMSVKCSFAHSLSLALYISTNLGIISYVFQASTKSGLR